MINYKKAFEMLKEEIINITPYCDNCKYNDYKPIAFNPCEDCHRKYIEWTYDPSRITRIEDMCNAE